MVPARKELPSDPRRVFYSWRETDKLLITKSRAGLRCLRSPEGRGGSPQKRVSSCVMKKEYSILGMGLKRLPAQVTS